MRKPNLDGVLDKFLLEFGALALIIFGTLFGLACLAAIETPDLLMAAIVLAILWVVV